MDDVITLAHGGGGEPMRQLIEKEFSKYLSNPILDELLDSAVFELSGTLAMTTDSYVISPIFFKNGDIGKLAVYGTLNDLCVVGARPMFMSLSFILEEGFPIKDLRRILESISQAAAEAGVKIVTGDTKVVERNKADKIFINTTGIGVIERRRKWKDRKIQEGDAIIISGGVGEHGIYIMLERLGVQTDDEVRSDLSNLTELVLGMLDRFDGIKFVRDATRGGVASVFNEISGRYGVELEVHEQEIPIKDWVRSAAEVLGVDPLYAANEGKVVVIVSKEQAEEVLDYVRSHPLGKEARIVGSVKSTCGGRTYLVTRIGTKRILESARGELLPRIC